MSMTKTLLATLLATLGATAAQAAALSLVSGCVKGSLAVRAGVNDQAVTVDASVDDRSGAGFLLGTGGHDVNLALTLAGTRARDPNPAFELASSHPERQGFNTFLAKLADRSKAFGKPVLLAHGDSHYFRLDKPMVLAKLPSGSAALENFTRLENFGSPSVHWVDVFVDARDPNVFSVVPHTVPGNVYPR